MNAPLGDYESNMRERELELEIARLNAEIETLRGEGEPIDSAARFLAMAASTVDQAMEDARREADEFAAEVSAEAEARRDEATRIAEEAEVRAETLRHEADQSENVVRQAELDADQIRTAAEQEAAELVTNERNRLADELEVLSGVRAALEEERGALESYHEELQRRVQELAESMVAFMTTEPPIGAGRAIDDLSAPELGTAEEYTAEDLTVEDHTVEDLTADVAIEATDDEMVETIEAADDQTEYETEYDAASEAEVADLPSADHDPGETGEPAEETATAEMAFVEYVIEPAPDVPPTPEIPEPAPAPPLFEATSPTEQPDEFDGLPVVDDPADSPTTPIRGGLFGRATDDEQHGSAGLFGAHGARLIEQTSPQELAAALADEDAEDERFRSFIDGDDDADPSRDWLLRPEQH